MTKKSDQPQRIPFNRPFIVGHELDYIAAAVRDGWLAGDGEYTERCQRWLETSYGIRRALLTHSCTAALEMAAILADIRPGDEVIMPSFTFVSTANAFVLRGAKVRFVDIREDTLNIDESRIEAAVSERTRAIVPVHYAGVACEMQAIMSIAEKHDLLVIEDAAQAIGARYGESYLGTLGHFGAFSFHETKNFISGEGGALLVNDARYIERAEIIREKGTDRAKFFRGEVDKYTWVDIGSSFLPSELIAAFLYAQLESADDITAKRIAIYDYYAEALAPLAESGVLRLPYLPPHTAHNAHMFYIICAGEAERDGLKLFLAEQGIHAVFHYVPLHLAPMAEQHAVSCGRLDVTERISASLLRLPCFYELTRSQQDDVIAAIYQFFGKSSRTER
jgi:dTDP-4-amino-4,6-dideoxygalactose transaminase